MSIDSRIFVQVQVYSNKNVVFLLHVQEDETKTTGKLQAMALKFKHF